jgi:hypothetical protein
MDIMEVLKLKSYTFYQLKSIMETNKKNITYKKNDSVKYKTKLMMVQEIIEHELEEKEYQKYYEKYIT